MIERSPTQIAGQGVELLERALGYTLGNLAYVDDDDLGRPTPCAGWDLARLLQHMDESLVALTESADGHLAVPPDGPAHPELYRVALIAPAGQLRDRACRLLAAWMATRGDDVLVGDRQLHADILAGTGALEVAVHGWDVASSVGRDHPLPAALAENLLMLASLVVTPAERPGRFAEPVPVSPDADPAEQLVAFLGRHPSDPLR